MSESPTTALVEPEVQMRESLATILEYLKIQHIPPAHGAGHPWICTLPEHCLPCTQANIKCNFGPPTVTSIETALGGELQVIFDKCEDCAYGDDACNMEGAKVMFGRNDNPQNGRGRWHMHSHIHFPYPTPGSRWLTCESDEWRWVELEEEIHEAVVGVWEAAEGIKALGAAVE